MAATSTGRRRRHPREMLYEALEAMQLLPAAEREDLAYEWGGHIADLLKLTDKPCVCPVCEQEIDDGHLYGTLKSRPWWQCNPSQAGGPLPPPPPPPPPAPPSPADAPPTSYGGGRPESTSSPRARSRSRTPLARHWTPWPAPAGSRSSQRHHHINFKAPVTAPAVTAPVTAPVTAKPKPKKAP